MVLYIFGVRGAAFVKVGYTAGCPWGRVRDGFWRVVHPKACCNRLGWDSLELLSLFPRDLAEEARLQARIPPECGEFWLQPAGGRAAAPAATGGASAGAGRGAL